MPSNDSTVRSHGVDDRTDKLIFVALFEIEPFEQSARRYIALRRESKQEEELDGFHYATLGILVPGDRRIHGFFSFSFLR